MSETIIDISFKNVHEKRMSFFTNSRALGYAFVLLALVVIFAFFPFSFKLLWSIPVTILVAYVVVKVANLLHKHRITRSRKIFISKHFPIIREVVTQEQKVLILHDLDYLFENVNSIYEASRRIGTSVGGGMNDLAEIYNRVNDNEKLSPEQIEGLNRMFLLYYFK